MTAPGQYAAGGNSLARSARGSVGRGVALVVIAVAVGAWLLYVAFDEPGDPSSSPVTVDGSGETVPGVGTEGEVVEGEGNGVNSDPIEEPTESTEAPPVSVPIKDPSQVKVVAVNGTGTTGLAGRTADLLGVHGYVTGAKNAAEVPLAVSFIYYRAGYSEDAKAVAARLLAPADIITPAPDDVLALVANSDDVGDFHIFVFLGSDEVITV